MKSLIIAMFGALLLISCKNKDYTLYGVIDDVTLYNSPCARVDDVLKDVTVELLLKRAENEVLVTQGNTDEFGRFKLMIDGENSNYIDWRNVSIGDIILRVRKDPFRSNLDVPNVVDYLALSESQVPRKIQISFDGAIRVVLASVGGPIVGGVKSGFNGNVILELVDLRSNQIVDTKKLTQSVQTDTLRETFKYVSPGDYKVHVLANKHMSGSTGKIEACPHLTYGRLDNNRSYVYPIRYSESPIESDTPFTPGVAIDLPVDSENN